MFVKVSLICGKQKKGSARSKKKKKNNNNNNIQQNKKKISAYNILSFSLEPTWSGLNNTTIVFVKRFSFLNHSRQRKEASQGANWDKIVNNLNSLELNIPNSE